MKAAMSKLPLLPINIAGQWRLAAASMPRLYPATGEPVAA
jgi:hypothetical protein